MTTPITTTTQLEAVPVGHVVRSAAGTIAARFDQDRGVVFGDNRPFPWIALELPATVLWPLPAPTVKPGRDAVLAALLTVEAGPSTNALADAVLAILPGKTEREVRAEALRDAVSTLGAQLKGGPATASSGYVAIGKELLGALDRLADKEAGK